MIATRRFWFVALSILSLVGAYAGEYLPILNLQGMELRGVMTAGRSAVLVVDGEPPHLLTFTNATPSQLKHRPSSDPKTVQVTYGRDLVGLATVVRLEPREVATTVRLIFETQEQAAAVEKVWHLREAKPSPLRGESGPGREGNAQSVQRTRPPSGS